MVSIGALKRTLAGKTVNQNGSTDISFDPPQFSLDNTFKAQPLKQQQNPVIGREMDITADIAEGEGGK